MKELVKSRGFLTIAHGEKRYIKMAKELAISLNLTNSHIPKALVTDSDEKELSQLYEYIIPIDKSKGDGIIQKCYMYDYSPFKETIFIDVDCLVNRSIDFLWDLFSGEIMSTIGRKNYHDNLFGVEMDILKKRFGLTYLTAFNGGIYYYKRDDRAKKVFDFAIDLIPQYDQIGIEKLRGIMNEEPLMSIAMGKFEMSPIDDSGNGMRTPIGQQGQFKINSLKGYCEFIKHNETVTPAIMHFGGGYPNQFHYRRETLKMRMAYYLKLHPNLVTFLVNGIYNPAYIIYVFTYRVFKSIFKGEKFKIRPLLPMFVFE